MRLYYYYYYYYDYCHYYYYYYYYYKMQTKSTLVNHCNGNLNLHFSDIDYDTVRLSELFSGRLLLYWLFKSRFRYDYFCLILFVDAIFKSCRRQMFIFTTLLPRPSPYPSPSPFPPPHPLLFIYIMHKKSTRKISSKKHFYKHCTHSSQ